MKRIYFDTFILSKIQNLLQKIRREFAVKPHLGFLYFVLFLGGFSIAPGTLIGVEAHAATSDTNEARATHLIGYLKKHSNSIQSKGANHYYRQVLWQLLALDFKTLSGPLKRELMQLLFSWSGSNLKDSDRADLEAELKKKMDGELDSYWDKMRLATLKEVDARDLNKDLRAALKDAFGKLRMSEAGLKRLDIFDKDQENFVNEMLFAGIMPSTSSDLANLGNDLITNLAGNTISGNFTPQQLTTMAMNIAKALGIKNSTTGKLLQEAVDSKIVQAAVGAGKMPEILERVRKIRDGLDDSAPQPQTRLGQPTQPRNGDLSTLADAVATREGTVRTATQHATTGPKIVAPKIKNPLKMARGDTAPTANYTNESSTSNGVASKPPPSPAIPTPTVKSPEAAKIEAAREIVDPRELLGGNFLYRNPKFTPVDPALKDHKGKAISTFEAQNFDKAREESIRAGAKIGTCDVKSVRSDKYCEQCGPDSKPCKCYEGMLKTVSEYEMRADAATASSTSTAADKNDLVEARIQETGKAVEAAVQIERQKRINEIKTKISDSKTDDAEKKKLQESLDLLAVQEKSASVDRGFYIRKVLLNGVMNTKTPACVLSKGRYGIGAKRDLATEPEWIYPGENYCHQFDLKPDEPFESLSKQDGIMLRLAMKTLEGLEQASDEGRMKVSKFEDLQSPTFSIGQNQVCSSRKLCELPKPISTKDLYYRIFSDETQDTKVRDLFDGETENTISRSILRCFGPREWGGMVIRILGHLQPAAEVCEQDLALAQASNFRSQGFLKTVCSGAIDSPAMTTEQKIPAAEQVARLRKKRESKILYFDRQGLDDSKSYCKAINKRYLSMLDLMRAAAQLNPKEVCSDKQIGLYERNPTKKH